MESKELMKQDEFRMTALPIEQLLAQVKSIQEVMESVMKKDEHYGVIPGCDKPSLYKAGAEKLSFVFRMAPEFIVEEKTVDREHREYRVTCTMRQIGTEIILGSGVGVASTMESKWRFRNTKKITERDVPKEYWDLRKADAKTAQELLGGPGFSAVKDDRGQWKIAKVSGKTENDNPADVYNTILKMAKKRAHVDAILTCTAASDIFSQDLEDIRANEETLAARSPHAVTTDEPASEQHHNNPNPAPVHADDAFIHNTGRKVPSQYWDLKKEKQYGAMRQLIGGEHFKVKKVEKDWMIFSDQPVEELPEVQG